MGLKLSTTVRVHDAACASRVFRKQEENTIRIFVYGSKWYKMAHTLLSRLCVILSGGRREKKGGMPFFAATEL